MTATLPATTILRMSSSSSPGATLPTARKSTLVDALGVLGPPSVAAHPLPLAHVTLARNFASIVRVMGLQPTCCKVFKRDSLYFFYGGAFYRCHVESVRDSAQLPVGFLFQPSLAALTDCYFPFDTGAMASKRFPPWSDDPAAAFATFRVPGNGDPTLPATLVQHVFGGNAEYLRGQPSASCPTLPEPIPDLHRFLTADFSTSGADHRQSALECQLTASVPIDNSLLWVGFPEEMMAEFDRMCRQLVTHVPDFDAYAHHAVFNPYAVCERLEGLADRVVRRYAAASA